MEELQRAAAAIAAGDRGEAHLILARIIKNDPNNVDAWLLLSETAATVEQKRTFLKRALLVDPDHPQAQARLAALDHEQAEEEPPATVMATVDETPDFTDRKTRIEADAVAEDEGIPDWLAGDDEILSNVRPPVVSESISTPEEAIPAWLRDEPGLESVPAASSAPTPIVDEDDTEEHLHVSTAALPDAPTAAEEDGVSRAAPVAAAPPAAGARQQPAQSPGAQSGQDQDRLLQFLEWALVVSVILFFLLAIYVVFG